MPAAAAAVVLALLAMLLLPRAALDAQVATTLVGYTVRDRAIVATSVGAGPAEVILIGGLHAGSETNTVALAGQLLAHFTANPHELPAEVTLTIIPAVNLDGLVAGTRANANGVDLNRNWPTDDWAPFALHGEEIVSGGASAGSEPEVASLHGFLLQRDPALVVSFHSVALVVQPNSVGLAVGYAMAYAADAGYQFIPEWPFYSITGELIVAMEEAGIPAFDVELSSNPGGDFAANLVAVKSLIRSVAFATAGTNTCTPWGTFYQQTCIAGDLVETYADGFCGTVTRTIATCEVPPIEHGPHKLVAPGAFRSGH